MNCQQAKELLSAYFDDELTEELQGEISQHATHCRECAEQLRSFETLRAFIVAHEVVAPPSDAWPALANRLEAGLSQAPNKTWTTQQGLSLLALIALAASLLVLLRPWNTAPNDEANQALHRAADATSVGVAIDFHGLLNFPQGDASTALESLSQQFAGQEAGSGEATRLLGYTPSFAKSLPLGLELVSMRVLKLPHCNCQHGQCTCGPGGCNCAVGLCERPDGSQFLVVEHCGTQVISFGDLPSEMVRVGDLQFKVLNIGGQRTATWLSDSRRLTVIGVNGREEAKTLVEGLASL